MKLFSMLAADSAATQNPNQTSSIILLVVMGVLLVGYFIYATLKRKKDYANAQQAINELKVGDKIVTTAGIFGTIKGITETTFGKVFLIETGEGKNVSYMNVGATAIWGLDTKEPVILDAEGNPINTPEDMKKAKEELLKDVKKDSTEVEEVLEEVKAEPKKKTTTKKSTTTKKTSTKKTTAKTEDK